MLTFKCSLWDRPAIAIKINNWKTYKKNTLTCKFKLSYVSDFQSKVIPLEKRNHNFRAFYQTRRQGEAEVLLTDFNSFFVHDEVTKEFPFNSEKE